VVSFSGKKQATTMSSKALMVAQPMRWCIGRYSWRFGCNEICFPPPFSFLSHLLGITGKAKTQSYPPILLFFDWSLFILNLFFIVFFYNFISYQLAIFDFISNINYSYFFYYYFFNILFLIEFFFQFNPPSFYFILFLSQISSLYFYFYFFFGFFL